MKMWKKGSFRKQTVVGMMTLAAMVTVSSVATAADISTVDVLASFTVTEADITVTATKDLDFGTISILPDAAATAGGTLTLDATGGAVTDGVINGVAATDGVKAIASGASSGNINVSASGVEFDFEINDATTNAESVNLVGPAATDTMALTEVGTYSENGTSGGVFAFDGSTAIDVAIGGTLAYAHDQTEGTYSGSIPVTLTIK
jgi:hypothetical protein